jgi:hypothetical protein
MLKNKLEKVFIALAAFFLLIILAILAFSHINRRTNKAIIEMVFEYLDEHYESEMILESFGRNIVEHTGLLTFSKRDNPNFTFAVSIRRDRETSRYVIAQDMFLDGLISYELRELYRPVVYDIWGEGTHIAIGLVGFNSRNFPHLGEHSTIDDIGYSVNGLYRIAIAIPYLFDYEDRNIEVEKILEFINSIKTNDSLPLQITVARLLNEDEAGILPTSVSRSARIRDICSIENTEQLIGIIEEQWF